MIHFRRFNALRTHGAVSSGPPGLQSSCHFVILKKIWQTLTKTV